MDKPSKPAGNSNKPENKPEIDPDRNRTGRGQPIPEGDEERVVDDGDIDGEEIEDEFGDEIEDDEDTAPTQRVDRGTRGDRQ
jgi:hypothetical protein